VRMIWGMELHSKIPPLKGRGRLRRQTAIGAAIAGWAW
jgi:hypothetical protein